MLTVSEKDILKQLERMNDRDSAVRRDTIESLAGIKDGRILYPIIKALQDEDQGVQQAAMDALIAFEDESAVYNVLPLLSDRRVYVRNMAREILEKIGSYGIELFSLHIRDKDEDARKMIADILGSIKRLEAKKLLIEMLKDPCSNVRSSAAEGLGRIGDSTAVELLMDLLDDEEWVAFFAAEALGKIGDSRAIKPLAQLASSSNLNLQIVAIEALGEISGEATVDSLLDTIDSISPDAINMAVKSIVKLTCGNIEKVINKLGRERFLEYLIEAMDDADIDEPDVKRDFIKAFSAIGSSQSSSYILKLISTVEMDNPDLLQIATDALMRLKDEDILTGALGEENKTCLFIAIRVLGLLKSGKAVPGLIALFEEADRDIKIEILLALGRIGGKDSLRFSIDMLSYGEGHIRGAAARGLGIMAVQEAIEPLLHRLQQEEYPDIVEEIVSALVEIGKRYPIPSLCEDISSNLSSQKPYMREILIKGLGMLGYAKAAEYAKGMSSDENWRVRRACLETLSHLNDPGLPDVLITAASDEKDEVRMLVAQLAVRYPGERSVDVLISLLTDRNTRVSNKAIEGLVKLKAAKAVPYLIELVRREEPSAQKASIWALGELGATEAENILKGVLAHQDSEIRDVAIEAYKKLKVVNNAIL